jgi:glycosyltransferase involved in cell wall biosynthesis
MHTLGGGGVQRVFINLAEGFLRRGVHDLWLVVNRAQGPFLKRLPSGVKLIDLRDPAPYRLIHLWSYLKEPQVCSPLLRSAVRVNYFILKGIGYLRRRNLQFLLHSSLLCLKLADYLRFIRPDALLSAYICNIPALLLKKFGFGGETRVTVSVHEIVSAYLPHNPAGGMILRLMRRLYPQAHNIVAVSQGVAKDLTTLLQLPFDRVTVIYNPVITSNLLEQALTPITHPWFERGQPPVILGVGQLALHKDFPTLLRAFALVRQVRPAKLLILGEGEERANLERLAIELGIQNDVSMPGFVDNPFAFMAKASVFVLSSAWEGLPTVLIEALACGCPVVATDCRSGPREILDNGRYGRLVPVGDHEALAKAILETLDNPDFPADRQTRLQRAMEFSVDAAVDKYLKVLLD